VIPGCWGWGMMNIYEDAFERCTRCCSRGKQWRFWGWGRKGRGK
jgi:hypothetical protein